MAPAVQEQSQRKHSLATSHTRKIQALSVIEIFKPFQQLEKFISLKHTDAVEITATDPSNPKPDCYNGAADRAAMARQISKVTAMAREIERRWRGEYWRLQPWQ